jgi:phenylpyruvate tautomerase PptA (4-oxalocrotonate tautomerase family)
VSRVLPDGVLSGVRTGRLPTTPVSRSEPDSSTTPVRVLDRAKQLRVVKEMTDIVASAADDSSLTDRTWVLFTEAPDGGWGIDGHAYTGADIAEAPAESSPGTRLQSHGQRRPCGRLIHPAVRRPSAGGFCHPRRAHGQFGRSEDAAIR